MKKQKKKVRSSRALSLSVAALAVAVIVVGGALLWQEVRGGKANVASGEGVSLAFIFSRQLRQYSFMFTTVSSTHSRTR